MSKLKLNGETLLACAWTTLEECRHFQIAPWVSVWDAVEGSDSEARPFFVGLNEDPNRMSNVRMSIFLPSCQSWALDYVFKITAAVLHGRKTANRESVSMLGQTKTEHVPFDNNTHSTLLRFCWCHRCMQKTKPTRRKNSPAATRLDMKNVHASCDHIACGVENENEHALVLSHMRQCVDIQCRRGLTPKT